MTVEKYNIITIMNDYWMIKFMNNCNLKNDKKDYYKLIEKIKIKIKLYKIITQKLFIQKIF